MTRGIHRNERGASAVEYGLIAAVVALTIGAVFALQASLELLFAAQACNEADGYTCHTSATP